MLCLVTQSCPTLCDPPGSSVHGDSPGKNTGVGCHALLQGICPIQESNPGLLHCRWILYCLSHQENAHYLLSLFKNHLRTHILGSACQEVSPFFVPDECKGSGDKEYRSCGTKKLKDEHLSFVNLRFLQLSPCHIFTPRSKNIHH